MAIPNNIRDLQLQQGDTGAFLNLGRQQSTNIADATPDLTSRMMELLRKYQGMGRQQEVAGQQEQATRILSQTSPDLIGASPTIQSQVRGAATEAIEPTIGGARSLVSEAKSLLTEYQQTEEKNQARAQKLIEAGISSGASGLEELLRVSPEVFKKAGYNTKEFEAVLKGLKAKEAEDLRQFNIQHPGTDGTPGGIPGISPTGERYKFETPQDIANLPVSTITKSVIAGYGDVKSLTPTDKSIVQQDLYKVGFNPFEQINRKLDALVETYKLVNPKTRGLVQGFVPARFSETASRFESEKTLLTREIARLRDVGMLSDQDVASYRSALPDRSDRNFEVAIAKIEGVKAALGSGLVVQKQGGTVRMSGSQGTFDVPENQIEIFKQNGYKQL